MAKISNFIRYKIFMAQRRHQRRYTGIYKRKIIKKNQEIQKWFKTKKFKDKI